MRISDSFIFSSFFCLPPRPRQPVGWAGMFSWRACEGGYGRFPRSNLNLFGNPDSPPQPLPPPPPPPLFCKPPPEKPSLGDRESRESSSLSSSSDADDLAELVDDFMENGSSFSSSPGSMHHHLRHIISLDSDRKRGPSVSPQCLSQCFQSCTLVEREVLSLLTSIIITMLEADRPCQKAGGRSGVDCKGGGCLRRMAVKHLRKNGYEASVCRSKWHTNGKLPGGEHEFVVVNIVESSFLGKEKATPVLIIIDLDFRSEFEIARPSKQYRALLDTLPPVFVGKSGKLEKVLHLMSEAAKLSLEHSLMHLPPWRTLDYMRAKWLSPNHCYTPCDGDGDDNNNDQDLIPNYRSNLTNLRNFSNCFIQPTAKQPEYAVSPCIEQLRSLKSALKPNLDHNHTTLKSNNNHHRGSRLLNPLPSHGFPEGPSPGVVGGVGPTGGGGLKRLAFAYRGTRRVAAVDFDF